MTDDRIDGQRGGGERDREPGTENNEAGLQVAAGDGLSEDNPSRPAETQEKVRRGQQAMARHRRGWDDWFAIGEALEVGQAEVMREVNTNRPTGRRYEKAIAEWLVANWFKEIDKATRSRLLDCVKHRSEIAAWRSGLTDAERFRFNHPNTLRRRWRAATTVPDPNAKPRTSPVAKLKKSIALLSEENEGLRRKIERDGGDLSSMAEGPNDIATADGKPSTPTQPEEDDKAIQGFRCCDIAAAGYAVGRPSEI